MLANAWSRSSLAAAQRLTTVTDGGCLKPLRSQRRTLQKQAAASERRGAWRGQYFTVLDPFRPLTCDLNKQIGAASNGQTSVAGQHSAS